MLLLVHGHLPGLVTGDGWAGCESEPGHTRLIRGLDVYVPRFHPHPQLYGLQSEPWKQSGWDIVLAVRYIALYSTTWES